MKPPEILAMIEEAAGTRMYEAKKQQAEKTIEKKDAKLEEINSILAEEINPTLTKLKEERSAYLEFQKIQRELEHLTKFYLAPSQTLVLHLDTLLISLPESKVSKILKYVGQGYLFPPTSCQISY